VESVYIQNPDRRGGIIVEWQHRDRDDPLKVSIELCFLITGKNVLPPTLLEDRDVREAALIAASDASLPIRQQSVLSGL
jgi:hypothetical protein